MTWSLGLFAAVTFVICVIYGLVMPPALHMTRFLEITLPGAYAGLVFTGIHNFIQKWCA